MERLFNSAGRVACGLAMAAVLATGLAGCNRVPPSVDVEAPEPVPLKPIFEGFAETGELSSEVMVAEERINAMKETDPAKADELLKLVEQLKQAQGKPAAVKSKSKEILGKL